jgi:hypothetical protein
VGLTILPPSCADSLETSGPVQACNGIALPFKNVNEDMNRTSIALATVQIGSSAR